jgi:hypothetical protein
MSAAMKLRSTETELIGKWELVNGNFQADATCERIEWLKTSCLEKIAASNWAILFRDPEDGRYWELTYPRTEMQGGGPPRLTAVSAEKAHAKYRFTGPAPSNNS